jgi:hypothetical protein
MSRGARATIELKLFRVGLVGLVADLLPSTESCSKTFNSACAGSN